MTAQRQPTPLAAHQCPHCARERAAHQRTREQLAGRERASALYLHDNFDLTERLVAVTRERDALRLLSRRGRVGWGETLAAALLTACDRLGALWGTPERRDWLGFSLACAVLCLGVILARGV